MKQKEYLQMVWSEFQSSTTNFLSDILTNHDFSDVTLACEGGVILPAHRVGESSRGGSKSRSACIKQKMWKASVNIWKCGVRGTYEEVAWHHKQVVSLHRVWDEVYEWICPWTARRGSAWHHSHHKQAVSLYRMWGAVYSWTCLAQGSAGVIILNHKEFIHKARGEIQIWKFQEIFVNAKLGGNIWRRRMTPRPRCFPVQYVRWSFQLNVLWNNMLS